MQPDYTIFQIPREAKSKSPADDFGAKNTETLQFDALTAKEPSKKADEQPSKQTTSGTFPLYEELNFIAEELEKWRSKIY